MPRQDIIQQTVAPQETPLPTQIRAMPIQSGFESGLSALSQGVAQATDYYEKQKHNEDSMWAGNAVADGNMYWDKRMTELKNSTPLGADGFTQSVGQEFGAYRERVLKDATDRGVNQRVMQDLERSLKGQEASLFSNSVAFQDKSKKDYTIYQAGQMLDKSMKLAQDNPATSGQTMFNTMTYINSLDVDPIIKTNLLEKAQKDMAYAAGLGFVQQAPREAAIALRESIVPLTGKTQFDQTMEFIFKREGGLNKNDGGGISNYGVNSVANPDIDVKNLTKDGAREIYRQRYWNEIGGSHLPPGVAMMAMDAAVNQGVGYAKKFLQESGGDINKMAALRAERYAEIIRKDPSQAIYQKEWDSRLQEATQIANQMGGSGMGYMDSTTIQKDHVIQTNRPVIDALDFGSRIKLLNYSDQQTKQQDAERSALFELKFNNFKSMAEKGAEIPADAVPSVPEMMSAYGPIEGISKYRQNVPSLVNLNSDLRMMGPMSDNEIKTLVARREPVPGDTYASDTDRQKIRKQAAEQLIADRNSDPASYSMKYSDQVKGAYSNMAKSIGPGLVQTPEATQAAQNYAAIAEQEQIRLGVKNTKILPDAIRQSLLTNLNRVGPQDGEQSARIIQTQANIWGSYWPKVYAELAPDLQPSALVIGSGVKPEVAEIMARSAHLKTSELKEGILSDDVQTINKTLQNSLSPLLISMSEQVGGDKTFSVLSSEIERLSLIYARRGMTADQASEKAYKDIIGDKYEFVKNYNAPQNQYRVPIGRKVNHIARAAEDILTYEDLSQIDTSRAFGAGDVAAEKQFYDSIRRRGYFVTNPDESGLFLYVNGAVLKNKDGSNVSRTWDELENMQVREYEMPSEFAPPKEWRIGPDFAIDTQNKANVKTNVDKSAPPVVEGRKVKLKVDNVKP